MRRARYDAFWARIGAACGEVGWWLLMVILRPALIGAVGGTFVCACAASFDPPDALFWPVFLTATALFTLIALFALAIPEALTRLDTKETR